MIFHIIFKKCPAIPTHVPSIIAILVIGIIDFLSAFEMIIVVGMDNKRVISPPFSHHKSANKLKLKIMKGIMK